MTNDCLIYGVMFRCLVVVLVLCLSFMQTAEARRFGGGHSRGYTHSYSRSYSRPGTPGVEYGRPPSGLSSGTKRALTAGAVGAAAGYVAGSAMASSHTDQTPVNKEVEQHSSFGFIKLVILVIIILIAYRIFIGRRVRQSKISQPDTLPDGTNTAVFMSQMMNVFMQIQQLNTPDQLEALKGYLTPNMYNDVCNDVGSNDEPAEFRQLQTKFEGCRREEDYWVVSVRFYGKVKENSRSGWTTFNEIWHFSKAGSEYIWRLAGLEK